MDHQRKIYNKILVYLCLIISCYLSLLLFSHTLFYLKMQDRRVEEIQCEKEGREKMNVKIDELIKLIESKDISHINNVGLELLKKFKAQHEQK